MVYVQGVPTSTTDYFVLLRYEFPLLGALNFVLHGALGGGVTRSLALDAHGKSLAMLLLDLDLDLDLDIAEPGHAPGPGERAQNG